MAKKLLLCLGIMACALFLYYGVITLLSGGPVTKKTASADFLPWRVSFWRDSFHYNGSQKLNY